MQRASDDQNMADPIRNCFEAGRQNMLMRLLFWKTSSQSIPDNPLILEEIADNELSLERYDRARTAALSAAALES